MHNYLCNMKTSMKYETITYMVCYSPNKEFIIQANSKLQVKNQLFQFKCNFLAVAINPDCSFLQVSIDMVKCLLVDQLASCEKSIVNKTSSSLLPFFVMWAFYDHIVLFSTFMVSIILSDYILQLFYYSFMHLIVSYTTFCIISI